MKNLIEPEHIGDGFYMSDEGHAVAIAINDHRNIVASIDIEDVDKAIKYLIRVKLRYEKV